MFGNQKVCGGPLNRREKFIVGFGTLGVLVFGGISFNILKNQLSAPTLVVCLMSFTAAAVGVIVFSNLAMLGFWVKDKCCLTRPESQLIQPSIQI